MASLEDLLSSAIEATLAPFLDEDICEYIQSTLAEDPHDEDARDNVKELLRGSIDGDADPEVLIAELFEKLKLEHVGSGEIRKKDEDEPLKRLEKTITMKEHDIKTYANGLSAEPMGGDHEDEAISSIQDFYANMIDISSIEAVTSERKRRKDRQRAIREELEDGERKRAIQDAMDILKEEETNDQHPDELMDAAADNSADVHIKSLDLPNLRGGGPDLLQNASLTLSRGRRYGLVRHQRPFTSFASFIYLIKFSFSACYRWEEMAAVKLLS